jgi:hypothetical protein
MIDVEEIENKYLIALQALRDIMPEVNRNVLREDFEKYLIKIKFQSAYEQTVHFLHELDKLPVAGEIRDIFIANDAEPRSLWFFLKGYCIEIRNFLETGKVLEEFQMTPLKRKAEWVNVKKQNFNIELELQTDEAPKLQISVKLDQTLSLDATGTPNCQHLLKIYREYFSPTFPI